MRSLETVKVKTLGPSMGPNGEYFLNEEGRGVLGYDFQRENLIGPNSNGWICTKNIMFDTRVCRGNTYARPIISESEKRNKYLQEKRKRGLLTRYKNGVGNHFSAQCFGALVKLIQGLIFVSSNSLSIAD
jgi:hypothetical protein